MILTCLSLIISSMYYALIVASCETCCVPRTLNKCLVLCQSFLDPFLERLKALQTWVETMENVSIEKLGWLTVHSIPLSSLP